MPILDSIVSKVLCRDFAGPIQKSASGYDSYRSQQLVVEGCLSQ